MKRTHLWIDFDPTDSPAAGDYVRSSGGSLYRIRLATPVNHRTQRPRQRWNLSVDRLGHAPLPDGEHCWFFEWYARKRSPRGSTVRQDRKP